MDAIEQPDKRRGLRQRLAEHRQWTPELRKYAVRYIVANTIRPHALALQEIAEIPAEDQGFFKNDIAQVLSDTLGGDGGAHRRHAGW